jgi:hypothetical protein
MFLIALLTKQSFSITLYRMTINECVFFLNWEHFSKITLANLTSYLTYWRKKYHFDILCTVKSKKINKLELTVSKNFSWQFIKISIIRCQS